MIKRLLISGGSTHTMYSLGTGFSWVAPLAGASITVGTGADWEAQAAEEHPSNVWTKQSRQAGTELLSGVGVA